MVNEPVGFDAGKLIQGRKRFLTVDTLGLGLRVFVTAASGGEPEGGKRVLKRVKRMDKAVVSRLHPIWVAGGFDGAPFRMGVMATCRWLGQGGLRPEPTQGFVRLKKRWVVERTALKEGLPPQGTGQENARLAGCWGQGD